MQTEEEWKNKKLLLVSSNNILSTHSKFTLVKDKN